MPWMQRIRLSGSRPAGIVAAMRFFLFVLKTLAALRTRAELRRLSDRTLRDIGLSRAEIDSLFR
jgi:uncharacterized protein YjiS (DUF1127 family)